MFKYNPVNDPKQIAKYLECYRMKSHEQRTHCQKNDCPYNNGDPEHGYWCCSNNLLHDASVALDSVLHCGGYIIADSDELLTYGAIYTGICEALINNGILKVDAAKTTAGLQIYVSWQMQGVKQYD